MKQHDPLKVSDKDFANHRRVGEFVNQTANPFLKVPQAIAGATLWATRFNGKLNGEMPETGPMGNRRTSPVLPLADSVMSSCSTSP